MARAAFAMVAAAVVALLDAERKPADWIVAGLGCLLAWRYRAGIGGGATHETLA